MDINVKNSMITFAVSAALLLVLDVGICHTENFSFRLKNQTGGPGFK